LSLRLRHLPMRILSSGTPPAFQRRYLRLLPDFEPGDGAADDHALDLRGALEDREARGGTGSFRR
jgi:hypothetical protein